MNRNIYFFAIFFCCLLLMTAVVQSVLQARVAGQQVMLDSFLLWATFTSLLQMILGGVIIKYYHYRKYHVAFYTALASLFAFLFFFVVTYLVITSRQLTNLYIPALFINILMSVVYGFALIFSKVSERGYLKAAGIFLVMMDLILIFTMVYTANPVDAASNPLILKIQQWTAVLTNLGLVLFLLNFLKELKTIHRNGDVTTGQRVTSAVMVLVSVGSFFAFFFIAEQVMSQSYWLADWANRSPARAQMLAEPFEARTFVGSNGDTLLYRLQKPLEYDSTKKYPLVVCLHHGGAHGNDNVRQIEGSDAAQVLTSYENKREHPAFIFVPQCPKGAGWGGIPELPSIDSLVFEAMASLEEEFSVEPKKRYVIGVSGGGYGSWHFITKRPDLFAAAIPICGGTDPTLAPNIVSIPVWAFHGAKDHLVPVRFSREMIDAIKNAGGNPKYTEFPEARHNIWPLVNETPGWVDWLFSQEKK